MAILGRGAPSANSGSSQTELARGAGSRGTASAYGVGMCSVHSDGTSGSSVESECTSGRLTSEAAAGKKEDVAAAEVSGSSPFKPSAPAGVAPSLLRGTEAGPSRYRVHATPSSAKISVQVRVGPIDQSSAGAKKLKKGE